MKILRHISLFFCFCLGIVAILTPGAAVGGVMLAFVSGWMLAYELKND